MPQTKHRNIGLIVDCLSFGGAEKSASVLSNILEKAGYSVVLVVLKPEVSYDYSGKLIHLGKQVSSIKFVKQFQKIIRFRSAIKKNPNTIWIDYRMRNRFLMEFLIHNLIYKSEKVVLSIHNFNINYHFPKGDYFKKEYAKYKISAVSKAVKEKILLEKELESAYIPNAIDFESVTNKANEFDVDGNYIIAVGRLNNEVKQFNVLIRAYSQTVLKSLNIKLFILGEGKDKERLHDQINDLNLNEYVKLLGFKENPYPYIKKAKFLTLTSRVEGLPMVILEALNLFTPVVAYNCPSGPEEMIVNNVNGLLVKNQNETELIKSIDYLVLNEVKRSTLINHSHDYLLPYTTESHLNYWEDLFKTL